MLLNELNKKKEIQILKKYKSVNKYKIKKILFNNMIFIFDNTKEKIITNIMMLFVLKWKQLFQIQKKLFKDKLRK